MAVWSLATSRSIARARANYTDMAAMESKAQSVSYDLARLEQQLSGLKKKLGSIDEIDSRIDVSAVLGELSSLIKEEIVLSKVEFIAEKFKNEPKDKTSSQTVAVVRAVRVNNQDNNDNAPLGKVRFKILIAGIAANSGAVADLTLELEKSPYFFQVKPSYSRSKELKIKTESTKGTDDSASKTPLTNRTSAVEEKGLEVSEFEITCYLANYRKL
jgi:hypothetical protein